MTVTAVEEITKTRRRVYLDGRLAFVLYRGELSRYGIAEGAELPEAVYREILDEVLLGRAKRRLIHLLESMDRTELQLRRKLEAGGYPEEIIRRALAYVQERRYQDDERYARHYADSRRADCGRRRLAQELVQRGIDRRTAQEAAEAASGPDEAEAIRGLLEKKGYDAGTADSREKRRVYAFLLRRGFCPEDVRRAMELSGWE